MPASLSLPQDDQELAAVVKRCRRMLHRRAMMAAFASAAPLPGLDWLVDVALLSKLIPDINKEFGLSPTQIAQLDPDKRERAQAAIALVGSALIGRLITRDTVVFLAKKIGARISTAQASKYVPIIGQVIGAAAGFAAMRYFGEEHMKDCIRIASLSRSKTPSSTLFGTA